MGKAKKYYVYILECSDGSYYTGYTDDLLKRYRKHLFGDGGCKYTKSHPPKKIARSWEIEGGRGGAMRIESFIKRQTRTVKEKIVRDPERLEDMLNNRDGGLNNILVNIVDNC